MGTFITLLKREYWENKTGYQWVPVGVTGLILFTLLLTIIFLSTNSIKIAMGEHNPADLLDLAAATVDSDTKSLVVSSWYYSNVFNMAVVMAFVGYFYCLSCLYDDRKDKSILFWKSLPISDMQTVLSKVVSVCLVLPLMVWVIVVFTNIAMMFLGLLFALIADVDIAGVVFSPLSIIRASGYQLFAMLVSVLWVFPFIGYLIFVSSATKKVPFLISWLPLIIISVVEGIVFKSSILMSWIGNHLAGLVKAYTPPFSSMAESAINKSGASELADAMSQIGVEIGPGWGSYAYQFADIQLWLGLGIGTLFIVGAVYIRRYRDEAL